MGGMMRYRLLRVLYGVAALVLWPMTVLAQDEEEVIDARLEGYSDTAVKLESGSTAMTYLLLLVLVVVGLAALFKNAKRTHLD